MLQRVELRKHCKKFVRYGNGPADRVDAGIHGLLHIADKSDTETVNDVIGPLS